MTCEYFDGSYANLFEPSTLDAQARYLTTKRARVRSIEQKRMAEEVMFEYHSDRTSHLSGIHLAYQTSVAHTLKHVSTFAQWADSLAKSHSNCRRIPVQLVMTMAIRMISHLGKTGVHIQTDILATTFWVSLKFYSSRDTIPNASFMALVTGVEKSNLLLTEPKILSNLGWDLYAFYKVPSA